MKLTNLRLPFFPTKKSKKINKSTQSIYEFPSSSSDGSKSLCDQTISKQELEAVLRCLNATEDEVAAMVAESSEGYNYQIIKMEQADEAELKETFAVFDTDGDGRISAEELREMLIMLGDEHCAIEECRHMIRLVDQVGDGFVCFGDFVQMMDGGSR